MAVHALGDNFTAFFGRLNPGGSFVSTASSEHTSIRALIENPSGSAGRLSPQCFLQGSYRQETAIYSINDVDIVALCQLWFPASGSNIRYWTRDQIFATIAAPLLEHGTYRDKVIYGPGSMCIKLDLGIKVEILPVVYSDTNSDAAVEPFHLFRPEHGQWEPGYARYHQAHLTNKNGVPRTAGNFKPMIKVLKHLRTRYSLDAVSFHLECLLNVVPDQLFVGGPAWYIPNVLSYIAQYDATAWSRAAIRTPCGERYLFSPSEWNDANWSSFHSFVCGWQNLANVAAAQLTTSAAIAQWQRLLGDEFFPVSPS